MQTTPPIEPLIPCFHCDYKSKFKNNHKRHHLQMHPNVGYNYADVNAVAYYRKFGLVLHYEDHTCEAFTDETLARIRETARVGGLRLCEPCLVNHRCAIFASRSAFCRHRATCENATRQTQPAPLIEAIDDQWQISSSSPAIHAPELERPPEQECEIVENIQIADCSIDPSSPPCNANQ